MSREGVPESQGPLYYPNRTKEGISGTRRDGRLGRRLGRRQRQILDLLHVAQFLGPVDLSGPQIARACAQSYADTSRRLVRLAELGMVTFHRIDPDPPCRSYLVWRTTCHETPDPDR